MSATLHYMIQIRSQISMMQTGWEDYTWQSNGRWPFVFWQRHHLFDSQVLGILKDVVCCPACLLHIPRQIADLRNVVRREDYTG